MLTPEAENRPETGMTARAGQAGRIGLTEDMRDHILSDPEAILEDAEVMRALIAANDRAMGENIVDLRGVALRRLEGQLGRLEDTHRGVIAAAYENLAGANIVQRAILQVLDPLTFEDFLTGLTKTVAATLRVETLRLVLESQQGGSAALSRLGDVVCVVEPGFVDSWLTAGRNGPVRQVVLRQTIALSTRVHGDMAPHIRSEAGLRLDLGAGRLPGLLVLGAEDPHQFRPSQGTDLLAHFGAVFERVMRRWLA
jgi:uncharacterized protein